ncbi:MAG: lipopolysaccharide kinase InaA family protein [Myxococcota bacterium]
MKNDRPGHPVAAGVAHAPGRDFTALATSEGRGQRLRGVDPYAVAAALAAGRPGCAPPGWTLLKADSRARVLAGPAGDRSLVVKVYARAGPLRRVVDALRGSPARRAWRGGHGLRTRGVAAATPCAYIERRWLGLPVGSAVVLEDLRALHRADRCPPGFAEPAEIVDALIRLALRLHRQSIVHGDLKASHVLLGRADGRLETRVIDLEGVRFRSRLRDAPRIRALAELNASLPDAIDDSLRCRAFERYAGALPFDCGAAQARRAIVDRSLARRHRWTGRGCADARGRAGPSAPLSD